MDEMIMTNYLMILKSTIEVYIHGTLESSNEEVRDTLKEGLLETLKHQSSTYDLMVSNGWYKVDNVNSSIIKNTIKRITK